MDMYVWNSGIKHKKLTCVHIDKERHLLAANASFGFGRERQFDLEKNCSLCRTLFMPCMHEMKTKLNER